MRENALGSIFWARQRRRSANARKRARINLSKILFQRNVSAIEEETMTKTEKAFFYRTAAEVAPDNPGFMTAKSTSRAKGSAKTAKS